MKSNTKLENDKPLLEKLYIVEKLSLSKIAKKFKVCRSVITRLLRKHNIRQRTLSEEYSDIYTPFRYYLKSNSKYIRTGKYPKIPKNKKDRITLPYLKQLWEKQKGICAYTGIKMKLYTTSLAKYSKKSMKDDIRFASLDRIDSKKPYQIGNIQFVTWPINLAKNDLSDKQMKRYVNLIIENKSS
jgi:IS30 family transposase